MKKNLFFIILFSLVVGGGVFAESAEPKEILFTPFDVASRDKAKKRYQEFVPDMVTAYLAPHSEQIQVVERKNLSAVLAEQGLRLERMLKDKSFQKLGQLTQARYVVRGSLTETRNQVHLQTFLYDTETTQLLKSFKHTGTWKSIPKLCQTLATDLASSFSTNLKTFSDLPTDKDPAINLHMIYGLGYFYNGQFHKAMPEFLKVMEKRSNHSEAKFWLARTLFEADMKGHAKIELKQFVKNFPNHPKVKEVNEMLATMKNKKKE